MSSYFELATCMLRERHDEEAEEYISKFI